MDGETLKEYLKDCGLKYENIEDVLKNAKNDEDIKEIYHKILYLEELKCNSEGIKKIFTGNPLIISTDLEKIKELVEYLKSKGVEENVSSLLEAYPNILDIPVWMIKKNEELLENYIPKEKMSTLVKDRTEIFMYNNDYLENRIDFLIDNSLENKLENIIMEDIGIFDLREEEIDVKALREKM